MDRKLIVASMKKDVTNARAPSRINPFRQKACDTTAIRPDLTAGIYSAAINAVRAAITILDTASVVAIMAMLAMAHVEYKKMTLVSLFQPVFLLSRMTIGIKTVLPSQMSNCVSIAISFFRLSHEDRFMQTS